MKQQATFVDWDFTDVWDIKECITYPYLRWQEAPVASFIYSPQYPTIEDTITFDASSSYDPDGNITAYNWDFGDGNTSSGEIVTHRYTTAGTYIVTLTVANNEGETNSISKDIFIGVTLAEALDNTELNWATGGDTKWFGQTETYIYDNDSAQSAHIGNLKSTYIETNVTGPGNLSFYWKVSSESNYDFLRFYIDDIEQANISGEVDWHRMSFDIGPGSHTLKCSKIQGSFLYPLNPHHHLYFYFNPLLRCNTTKHPHIFSDTAYNSPFLILIANSRTFSKSLSFCDLKNACNIIRTTSDFVSSRSFELLAMYSTRSAIDSSTLVSITFSFFISCYIVTDDI